MRERLKTLVMLVVVALLVVVLVDRIQHPVPGMPKAPDCSSRA